MMSLAPDLGSLLLDPIYDSALGVPALVMPNGSVGDAAVTVIDYTTGVEISTGPLTIPSIRAAVDVRVSELAANGLSRQDLSDGQITLWPGQSAQKTWRIESVQSRPGPLGEASGELRLILLDEEI